MVSLEEIWMPSSIQGCCLILGVDVIDANLPLEALASKAKPKPGSGTRQPKTRSRPPSMTSSAAGHLLREEELQDVDQDMDLLSLYSWSDVASD